MSGRKSGKTFPSKLDNFSSHWDLHFRQNVKWSRDKQREKRRIYVTGLKYYTGSRGNEVGIPSLIKGLFTG